MERYIRTLISLGFLKINYVSEFRNIPTLSLTDNGLEFLDGDENLKVSIYGKDAMDCMQDVDKNLYEALRNLRKQIAGEIEMPAYIVCSNEPLLEMARQKPIDYDSMIKIKGIGKRFRERYGERFLEVIKGHNPPENLPNGPNTAKIEYKDIQSDDRGIHRISSLTDIVITRFQWY